MPHRIISSGEMANLTREFHWEDTTLGPIESWPDELISTVNLLLASRYPMFLWWGPELIQFYNDAYRQSIREDKHPSALGQNGRECWREIWPTIGPEIERVLNDGEATWSANRLVPINRNGRMEEVFWTYSYIPVRDREGRAEGVLVVCSENTEQMLNERRLQTLLAIGKEGPAADLAQQLIDELAGNRSDIPFSLLYRVEKGEARLAAQGGLKPGIEVQADALPILEVAESKELRVLDSLTGRVGNLICEPWPEAVERAYVSPAGTLLNAQYVLVLGINPRVPFDTNYETFFHLLADRICGALEIEGRNEERREAEAQRLKLFQTVDQQRELLTTIVDNAPAGIAVLDNEFRFRWHNPYFMSLLDARWKDAGLLGVDIRVAVPQAEQIMRILERVRETHEAFTTAEYEHEGFARGTTYWRWSAGRLANGDILIVSSEVTEQVAARRRLEVVGERLQMAQKAAHLGTYYWHVPSGKLEWSPEFYEVTGFNTSDKADWEFYLTRVHQQDRERLRRELGNMTHLSGALRIHDHRLTGDDGKERWAALNGHIHLNSYGTAERIIGTVADVTERRQTEKDLKASKKEAQQQWAELDAIYGTAPIGLALFDPVEFRFLRLNRRQAEIVGMAPEDILGKTLSEIVPIEGLREMFEKVARGEPVINALLEGELPTSPGEHRYFTVNFSPVYDADGSIQAISGALLEVTAQKRAELALVQSEKIAAVGRLASSISHEINNPLEAVTNLIYLLKSEELSPDGQEYLGAAERELARVSHIATHTLRFHRQSTKATETGAADLIAPILALHQGRISSSAIKVERDFRTETKVLCFDGEIRQVLNNLIGNSIDAMWRGGRLVVRSQVVTHWPNGGKELRITIADTGHGMNEVTKRRLFEAFFTTKGIKGTGLGLWISSEIVRKHCGRLRFRSSERPDRSGTVFQLFLPLEPAFVEEREAVRMRSN